MARPWRRVFLKALRVWGEVQAACRLVGISSARVYQLRKQDADFEQRWDEAIAAYNREVMELQERKLEAGRKV